MQLRRGVMDEIRDVDPIETQEWIDAIEGVIEVEGSERAHFLLDRILHAGRKRRAVLPDSSITPYLNTIPLEKQEPHPGDRAIEHRIRSMIAEMTVLAAAEIERFGLTPCVAFVSHSSFGTAANVSAEKMRAALPLVTKAAPSLEVEGEMHADAALSRPILSRVFPSARLTAEANLLIMPNLDAANITFNALKVVGGQGVSVGPILLGAARPAHILTQTATVRGIVNMSALAVVARISRS